MCVIYLSTEKNMVFFKADLKSNREYQTHKTSCICVSNK